MHSSYSIFRQLLIVYKIVFDLLFYTRRLILFTCCYNQSITRYFLLCYSGFGIGDSNVVRILLPEVTGDVAKVLLYFLYTDTLPYSCLSK